MVKKSKTILDIALGELGVKEIRGKKHNPEILKYHAVTTLNATTDEIPWCSSFVNWCVAESGKEPTRSAMAASWKRWGKSLKTPKKGCIIGFVREDGTGHVGIFISGVPGKYKILGGNQDNSVNVSSWNIANRDWFFVEPKGFNNSKIARAGAGSVATGAALTAPTLLDLIKQIQTDTKQTKEGVTAITETLAGDNKELTIFQEYSPIIIILLSAFIIYDRLKKERVK